MPKGYKTAKTVAASLEKEVLRAELRRMVGEAMGPMVEAQIANARGLKYLVTRDGKSGKFTKVTEAMAGSLQGDEVIEVWEKDPSVQAFTDLLNRTIDKPIEQVDSTVKGTLIVKWEGE